MNQIKSIIFALVIGATVSGCTSISSAEMEGIQNTIQHIHNSSIFKFEAARVSDGTVQGQAYRLVKVSYTDPTNPVHPRNCSYLLYHHDKEAGMLTGIEISLGDDIAGTCSVRMGCFGCNGAKFFERLKERQYTGTVDDI